MSAPDEILSDLLDALNDAGQLDGYSVWCETDWGRWTKALDESVATARLSIRTPGGASEVAYLIAHPIESDPDDGAAADRARDAAIDQQNGVL
ncbi:hypothetical protein [Rhodococcus sp. USK13]|uniref:hypothetical protein n=1 Tax=Rhodococcus sp. USK13 TaxID=2806442 RepID=UPI001BCE075D|nr:hypothetical protein [Rhodococcus sp. USK13]